MARLTTFVAVNIPAKIKEDISKLQEELKKKNLPISWANAQNVHITLVYFGKISESRVAAAGKAVAKTAQETAPFPISLGQIAHFPREKRTRQSVVFLEVLDPEKRLRQFYKKLFVNLTAENFFPPARLHPHITLGRVAKQRAKGGLQQILSTAVACQLDITDTFVVDKINMYEAVGGRLTTGYHLLNSFQLENEKA